ncbi:AAA family ATPase [Microbacter sp. GSS18]|nr:AAA family ATPase [Microbacter sp. GSS18]
MTLVAPGTHRAYAAVVGRAATLTFPGGRTLTVAVPDGSDIRHEIIRTAVTEADRTGEPIELITSGDRGDHRLLIDPDGTLTPLPTLPDPADEIPTEPAPEPQQPADIPADIDSGATGSSTVHVESSPRPSFISPAGDLPTPAGWRGIRVRLGFGPSPMQIRRQHAIQAVSRQWAGCRSIAVVNGKGGVGKTMTTAMLAAVYARHGGGNVLAWDNNDTRGTLGWRTEQGVYDSTIRDLIPAAGVLLDADATVSSMTRFVHHQSGDRYDVLRSNPELLATDQRITTAQFDQLMQVAAKFYRLVVFDSGNDESADRWLRMIDSSHQLVIPTLANRESAESARLLLEALRGRDARSARLADNAVVIVTQAERASMRDVFDIADGFTGHVRAVHPIPFDPALKAGPLRHDTLKPGTRDAWTEAAASATTHLY